MHDNIWPPTLWKLRKAQRVGFLNSLRLHAGDGPSKCATYPKWFRQPSRSRLRNTWNLEQGRTNSSHVVSLGNRMLEQKTS
ncbi:hypothetical protein D918_01897 [Trichuris suis]|nr:hypothetical protein D918_01897 [Trichuris suis]